MATTEDIKKEMADIKIQIDAIMTVGGQRRRRTSLMSSEIDLVLKLTDQLNAKKKELYDVIANEKKKEILQTKIKKLAKEKLEQQKENERIRRIENRLKIIAGGWVLSQLRDAGFLMPSPDGKTGVPDEKRMQNYEKRITAAAGNTSYDTACFKELFRILDEHRKELLADKDAECPRPSYPKKTPQNKKSKEGSQHQPE